MKHFLITTALLSAFAMQAEASDVEAGKELVNTNCFACHGTELYTRNERRVSSRKGLSTQVQRCQLALDLNWFDEDVENAAEYLNKSFYHFGN